MIKIMTNKNKNNIIITKPKLIVRNLYKRISVPVKLRFLN